MIQIFEKIKMQDEYAQQIYVDLLDYDDDKVRFEAAVCCLKLKKSIQKAEKVLKHISQSSSNPIVRFNAEMVLETWKEKRCLL